MIWGCNTFQSPVATLLSVGHQQSPFSVLILDPMAYFLSIGTWWVFFPPPFGFFSHVHGRIWTRQIEWQLTLDCPHQSRLPYHWFILYNPLCFSDSFLIFSTPSASLLNCNDCNDTQKRWLSGFGNSAFLHVTHPLAITSANKLIQCAEGKHVGIVGVEEVRRGLGCEKRD